MTSNEGGSASVFEIPLSLNQTPVSGVKVLGDVSTGAFFSGIPDQPQFQGASDLLGGTSFQTSGSTGIVMAGALVLLLALALRGK